MAAPGGAAPGGAAPGGAAPGGAAPGGGAPGRAAPGGAFLDLAPPVFAAPDGPAGAVKSNLLCENEANYKAIFQQFLTSPTTLPKI